MVFFYEKCIMHNQLPDYHIVAPAICETSNPAVLWKLNLQTRMICTAALNPHQRGPVTKWDARSRAGLLRSITAAGGERVVFRGFARELLHTLGKPRVWEDQCLRQQNSYFPPKPRRFIGGCNRLNTAASSKLRFLHYQGKPKPRL